MPLPFINGWFEKGWTADLVCANEGNSKIESWVMMCQRDRVTTVPELPDHGSGHLTGLGDTYSLPAKR